MVHPLPCKEWAEQSGGLKIRFDPHIKAIDQRCIGATPVIALTKREEYEIGSTESVNPCTLHLHQEQRCDYQI